VNLYSVSFNKKTSNALHEDRCMSVRKSGLASFWVHYNISTCLPTADCFFQLQSQPTFAGRARVHESSASGEW